MVLLCKKMDRHLKALWEKVDNEQSRERHLTSWENTGLFVAKYSDSNEVRNPDFQNIAFLCLDVSPVLYQCPVSIAIVFKTELGALTARGSIFSRVSEAKGGQLVLERAQWLHQTMTVWALS